MRMKSHKTDKAGERGEIIRGGGVQSSPSVVLTDLTSLDILVKCYLCFLLLGVRLPEAGTTE